MLLPDPPDDIRQAISGSTYKIDQCCISDEEEKAMREFKAAARKCIEQLSQKTLAALETVTKSVFAGSMELNRLQRAQEETEEVCLEFWTDAARSSIGSQKFCEAVDLSSADWLGSGKWGWVMRSRRKGKEGNAVVKVTDLKHSNIVVKEWKYGHELGKRCPEIVKYESVYLYGDDESRMRDKLRDGHEVGKLKSAVKRTQFPEHYVCMILEYMNAGSVQDWIDKEILRPEGMLVVLRSVASALAHMHEAEVTHNDLKPENILLHKGDQNIIVKLGDLGLAEKSLNRTSDITRFGMTTLCMCTGEKFGSRRLSDETMSEFVADIESCAQGYQDGGAVGDALQKLPEMVHSCFKEETTMKQVKSERWLRGLEFRDEGGTEELQRHNGAFISDEGGATSAAKDTFGPPNREAGRRKTASAAMLESDRLRSPSPEDTSVPLKREARRIKTESAAILQSQLRSPSPEENDEDDKKSLNRRASAPEVIEKDVKSFSSSSRRVSAPAVNEKDIEERFQKWFTKTLRE